MAAILSIWACQGRLDGAPAKRTPAVYLDYHTRVAGDAPPRYHSLDALRAAMMLLGLVLHGAASYTTRPIGAGWPYHDAHTHIFADLVAFTIHIFRMPLFFLAAGFFAALLHERDSTRGFVRNRMRRLLLPLALFVPLLLPLVVGGFAFAQYRSTGMIDLAPLAGRPSILEIPLLMHLWFVYHLAILCAVAALVATWAPAAWSTRARGLSRALVTPGAGAVIMIPVTWLTLLPMRVPGIETSAALLPPARVLLAYGVPFAFGWILYWHRDRLERFARRWAAGLSLGVLAASGSLAVLVTQPFGSPRVTFVAAMALRSASMWTFAFGWLGLFVRVLDHERPLVRYVSDAAYWIYILHLPVVIWAAGLLAPWPAPAVVKFGTVVSVTAAVTMASYDLSVRDTAIGRLLNGRRYPRGLPCRPEQAVVSET